MVSSSAVAVLSGTAASAQLDHPLESREHSLNRRELFGRERLEQVGHDPLPRPSCFLHGFEAGFRHLDQGSATVRWIRGSGDEQPRFELGNETGDTGGRDELRLRKIREADRPVFRDRYQRRQQTVTEPSPCRPKATSELADDERESTRGVCQ